ncbi:MAG: C25 family cysteine peptidase, partial [candidate division NC10 bacterium]
MQNQASYRANAFYPDEPAVIEDDSVVRGRRIVLLGVSPLAYDPARAVVRLYSRMTIRIRMPGGNFEQTSQDWGRFYSPFFDPVLARSVLNYYEAWDRVLEPPRQFRTGYLIIVGHDDFYAPMLPFVALKQSEHYEVTMVRLSDFIADPAGMNPVDLKMSILQEIIARYQALDPAPSFLLLVGDSDTIPPWNGDERPGANAFNLGFPSTDMFYACMDGAPDYRPDISYGRFPVRSADEATYMVDKYLAYAALTGNEPWLERIAFTATYDLDHYAEAEASHDYLIWNQTIPHHYSG